MASLLKFGTYICGFFLIALVLLQPISANTDDNEVGDAPEYTMIQGVKVYQNQRECVMVGGLCVHTSDCLEPTTTRGLCSQHSNSDIECCYELPMKPAPCSQHYGACMDRCNPILMRPGTDCQNGQVCCVLV